MSPILPTIVAHKRQELIQAQILRPAADVRTAAKAAAAPRDFCRALRDAEGIGLIAEIKRASPAAGLIRPDFDPPQLALDYLAGGADCLSVLTDEHFFQGHLDYLRQVREVVDLPLLRKDFILEPYQVWEARAAGADAVLLIAECLSPEILLALHREVIEWGMTPLVELYDESNVPAVLACEPKLVGVNNRNLGTFAIDWRHSVELRRHFPPEILFVSESGIGTAEQVQQLAAAGVDAVLVGQSLMKHADVTQACRKLLRLTRSPEDQPN